MSQPGAECPDYLKRLLNAAAAGAVPRGSVRVATVRHEAGCPLLRGRGPCTCQPEIELGPDVRRGDS